MKPRSRPKKTNQIKKEPEASMGCPLVAMGASAGGLEVFQEFFKRMPSDTGIAFVLVQHLDPNHETLMPELLSKHTDMPVLRVQHGLKIQANHVYVIAPNISLTLRECRFQVETLHPSGDRKVIDQFLRSVAEDQQRGAVGVVLTGTGADGTLGLKAIKEHGGLTMAQDPATAKFDSMPHHAIASGFVDVVLPVTEMPGRIVEYIQHLELMVRRANGGVIQQEVIKDLPKIFPILRKQTGHDFSGYKQSTLVRRVQRRMQVVYLDSASKYVQLLKENREEVDALFKDLLIGVTQFFRDAESFEALAKKVVPALFQEKNKDSQLRVWVPGCSSGEEAYSLAILLAEYAEKLKDRPKIQVFATDLDVEALEFARKAKYPEEVVDQISPKRLKRYFKATGAHYEVVDEIREMCIFSPHNLIKDPPFSRLDMISCRNLLIYLEADVQKKLLPLFHYALNPCGYLFLGPSENVASRSELFRGVDVKHRVFQRKPTMLPRHVHVPLIDSGQVTRLQVLGAAVAPVPREQNMARSIERVIIEEYAPACAVINDQGEVLYFSGNTGRFLEPPAGVPSNKIIAMARKNLRLELRTAVHRAISTGKEVIREAIPLRVGKESLQIDLVVRPLPELGHEPQLYIVLFRELMPGKTVARKGSEPFLSPEHPIIKQLESELRTTKEDLQTTIEELETSNEELKSANEELLSMNEELQSANEELQTSKEELQSTNDELQRKMEETDSANAELRRAHEQRARFSAIVQHSEDAIIGKTLEGIVTSWNRAAERIFGYTEAEMIGNSITKIIPPERHGEEVEILSRLRRGESIQHYETERVTKDGRRIFISLTSSPVRDPQGFIIGAAKIARDITTRRQAEELKFRMAAIVESSDDAIISTTLDGVITTWNKGAERTYGYTAAEVVGKPVTLLIPADRVDEEPAIISHLKKGERVEHYETIRKRKDGALINVSLTVSAIKDANGTIIGASKIARDITERKQIEEALRLAKVELEERVAERTASLMETTAQLESFCYTIAHDLRSPLRAQQSFATVLLSDYEDSLDDKGQGYVRRIIASAKRLDRLVGDLLTYSRVSREELQFNNVELARLVPDVLVDVTEQINSSGAEVKTGNLLPVVGHEATLRLVIGNLINNALKFVAKGRMPRIHLWSENKDAVVRLWVEDNGIGIAPENKGRIFGVFQRLHPIDVYPGTGIGLAIVQKAVDRMSGKVGVESELGKGSRFWLELPKAR